jgi:hypothetical protein
VRDTGEREPARLLHRAVLAVIVVVGVLGMHSLMLMAMPAGSSSVVTWSPAATGDPAGGASAAAAGTAASASATGTVVAAVVTHPVGFGVELGSVAAAVERVPMPGAHECLAVLVAAAAALGWVLMGRPVWSAVSGRVVLVVDAAGWAAPRRTPSLAELSVLRV